MNVCACVCASVCVVLVCGCEVFVVFRSWGSRPTWLALPGRSQPLQEIGVRSPSGLSEQLLTLTRLFRCCVSMKTVLACSLTFFKKGKKDNDNDDNGGGGERVL